MAFFSRSPRAETSRGDPGPERRPATDAGERVGAPTRGLVSDRPAEVPRETEPGVRPLPEPTPTEPGAPEGEYDVDPAFVEGSLAEGPLAEGPLADAAAADTSRRLLEAMRIARAEAEEAARSKSDFLATMSHELRTPINAITGYAQLLDIGVAGPVTDAQRAYLARLLASGQHLLGLVDDVLDFANIERGQMTVARERLTTAAVVGAALAVIAPDAAARSVHLVDAHEGETGVAFIGDEHRVRQILLNLLSNAVKFTPPGGTVTVDCDRIVHRPRRAPRRSGPGESESATGPDSWVGITVRDTGIGIAPEHAGAIFEPFTQLDSSRTRTAGGTGLGLTISRRLARLMGGDLTVQSRIGGGSTFTLLLPTDPQTCALPPAAGTATRPAPAAWLGPQASPSVDPGSAPSVPVARLGALVREQIEEVVDRFLARLCTDPAFDSTHALSRAAREGNTLSLLASVLHTLTIVEEGGGLDGELQRGGGPVQDRVAFHGGEGRFRLGWTEAMVEREHAILAEETIAVARRAAHTDDEGTRRSLDVLAHLLGRAGEASARGFDHARRFAHV